uniref:C2H2-type domain-containing protein n=1 Tax=Parascaris univalens TaxID=6257 RepID=A0A915A4H2_PARUN
MLLVASRGLTSDAFHTTSPLYDVLLATLVSLCVLHFLCFHILSMCCCLFVP